MEQCLSVGVFEREGRRDRCLTHMETKGPHSLGDDLKKQDAELSAAKGELQRRLLRKDSCTNHAA